MVKNRCYVLKVRRSNEFLMQETFSNVRIKTVKKFNLPVRTNFTLKSDDWIIF